MARTSNCFTELCAMAVQTLAALSFNREKHDRKFNYQTLSRNDLKIQDSELQKSAMQRMVETAKIPCLSFCYLAWPTLSLATS